MKSDFDMILDECRRNLEQVRPREKANGHVDQHSWRNSVTTAAKLQHQTFPPVSFVVPELIPEGLSIVAGRPKVGKSWLALRCIYCRCGWPILSGRAQAGAGRCTLCRLGR